MAKLTSLIVVLFVVGFAATATAQQSSSPPPQPQASADAARVNVDRLPLDIERVERQLRQSTERQDWDGFRLRYQVNVFGAAPRIQFFDPKEVLPSGPIPYGAPTHQEMIEVMTPREYRSPVMDFSAVMRWLQEKMK
jgi:hypothetical protein